MDDIVIILVQPQLGENIGATARAMKNFGLSELRIVSPRDGWPNEKAESMSVGAVDLIHSAKIFDSLEDAVKDLDFLYATTGERRDMNKDYIISRNLAQDLQQKGRVGILFGREATGLTNTEIAYANKILTINTVPDFSSLNIAHAVCLVCYEIFNNQNILRSDLGNNQKLATSQERAFLHKYLINALDGKGFFKVAEKKEHMSLKIQNILTRIDKLSHSDVQILIGIISSLVK